MRPFIESSIRKVLLSSRYSIRVAYAVSKCVDVDKIMTKRCPFCGKQFKLKSSLAHHIYTHDEFLGFMECVKGVLSSW